jgi:hypothetical protein
MSVISWREMPRVNRHVLGESPLYERRFVLTLSTPDTPSALMVQSVGVLHFAPHPEYALMKCFDLQVNEAYEGNPYYAELIARYAVPGSPEVGIQYERGNLLPWLRPDEWIFQTQGVAIPALKYFETPQSAEPVSLVNSAKDFIEGLTVDEAQQKIIIRSNRLEFPSALAAAVINRTNNSPYLGFPPGHVKVQGISGERTSEVINGLDVYYWKITSELIARESGWNLLIPDVGFNYIESGERKRATVKGPDEENIPSSSPVALNGAGGLQSPGTAPAILERIVYRRVEFLGLFGLPPVT